MLRRAPFVISASLSLGSTLWSVRAPAQVNVEPLRDKLADDGIGGDVSASVTAYRGNVEGTILGASGLLGLSDDNHLGYFVGRANYTQFGGDARVANAFAHARFNERFEDWFSWEAYLQAESNRFRALSRRALVGSGPRFTREVSESFSMFYGTAYMFELAEYSKDLPPRDAPVDRAHRWSHYGGFSFDIIDEVNFTTTNYYQPRFDEFGDYRALLTAGLRFSVTQRLSTKLDVSVRHESRVPEEVKKTDLEWVNAVQVSF